MLVRGPCCMAVAALLRAHSVVRLVCVQGDDIFIWDSSGNGDTSAMLANCDFADVDTVYLWAPFELSDCAATDACPDPAEYCEPKSNSGDQWGVSCLGIDCALSRPRHLPCASYPPQS